MRLLTTPYDPEEEARLSAQSPEWHAAQGDARRRFAHEQAEYREWRANLTPAEIEAYWPTTPPPAGIVVQTLTCQSPEDIERYLDGQ